MELLGHKGALDGESVWTAKDNAGSVPCTVSVFLLTPGKAAKVYVAAKDEKARKRFVSVVEQSLVMLASWGEDSKGEALRAIAREFELTI